MKKQPQNSQKTPYIKLLASMSNEKRLLLGLQLSKFINKLHKEGLPKELSAKFFIEPKDKSIKNIVLDFARSKKYSKAFLKDLEEGLSSSNYFHD